MASLTVLFSSINFKGTLLLPKNHLKSQQGQQQKKDKKNLHLTTILRLAYFKGKH